MHLIHLTPPRKKTNQNSQQISVHYMHASVVKFVKVYFCYICYNTTDICNVYVLVSYLYANIFLMKLDDLCIILFIDP